MINKKFEKTFLSLLIAFAIIFSLPSITHVSTDGILSMSVKAASSATSIVSADDINKDVYINDSYSLPRSVKVTMSDGNTKSVSVRWSPSRVSTSKAGTFSFAGTISGYSEKVNLTLTVIPVASIEDINETVNINGSYTLPKSVTATMGDGNTKTLPVKWNSSRVSTSKAGTFNYTGTVSGYSEKVNLTLTVIPVASIEDISETVYINDNYTLPKELTATMGDGSTRNLSVKWNQSKASTSKGGVFTYTGTVAGYSEKVNLTLTVIPVASIDNINHTVNLNDSYTLPTTLTVTMDDGSTKSLSVKWSSSKAVTSKAGVFTYTGTVAGYSSKVSLTLTVKPIASIDDISQTVYVNDNYTLPTTLTATMDDGSTRSVLVKWNPSKASTSKGGAFIYSGTVDGYSKKVNLTLTVIPITSIDDISQTVYVNDNYTLPTTLTATMGDGTTKTVAVKWNQSKANTSKGGVFTYTGTVAGYSTKVNLTLSVLPITSINATVSATVNQNDSYTLPKTAMATMSDGTNRPVEVSWSPSKANTSKGGIFTYTGTIPGYNNKITLKLYVNPLTLIDATVDINGIYTLPKTVTATMSDGSKINGISVVWDNPAVDTSKLGTYTFTGTLNGYINKVKLTLKVVEGATIKKVGFKTVAKPTYSKTFTFDSALTITESSGKDPIVNNITLSEAASKPVRLDLKNVAGTTYNALYIDKNSDGNYDKGTDHIVGQFTIITTGKFANSYTNLIDGIKVVSGDKGTITFRIYNADATKVKTYTSVNVDL